MLFQSYLLVQLYFLGNPTQSHLVWSLKARPEDEDLKKNGLPEPHHPVSLQLQGKLGQAWLRQACLQLLGNYSQEFLGLKVLLAKFSVCDSSPARTEIHPKHPLPTVFTPLHFPQGPLYLPEISWFLSFSVFANFHNKAYCFFPFTTFFSKYKLMHGHHKNNCKIEKTYKST